jgi:hypothetical protein
MTACPWRTGIAALCHPFSLASIALLLLNDHLLKRLAPSLLTGKLSDFAGLFFFPLLLGAVLGLLLAGLRSAPRLAPRLAFFLIFAVFAAIKTLPTANLWVSQAASRLFDAPVSYALDPSDLLALVMLLPAWRLWRRMEGAQPSRLLGYAALAAGSLASLATQPCMPPVVVDRLIVEDAVIYARGNTYYLLQSKDGGRNWTSLENPPQALVQSLETARPLPVQVCDPARPAECYRIAASGVKVEVSTDGGQTWRLGWQIPPGRLEYMQRSKIGLLVCDSEIKPGPYDLAIAPQGSGSRLVAAMGNEGVLVLQDDGSWRRYKALTSGPTPFAESDLGEIAAATSPELAIGFVIVYLYLLVMAIWSGIRVTRSNPNRRAGVFWPLWVGLPLLAAAIFFVRTPGTFVFLIAVPVLIIAIPLALWVTVARASHSSKQMAGVAWSVLGVALLSLAAAWLPWVLWGNGVIPYYALSLAFSILFLAGLLFWLTLKLVARVQRLAAE